MKVPLTPDIVFDVWDVTEYIQIVSVLLRAILLVIPPGPEDQSRHEPEGSSACSQLQMTVVLIPSLCLLAQHVGPIGLQVGLQ